MTVELSDKEAQLFRLLSEARVYDLKSGSFEVHVDRDGNFSQVVVHIYIKAHVINTPEL